MQASAPVAVRNACLGGKRCTKTGRAKAAVDHRLPPQCSSCWLVSCILGPSRAPTAAAGSHQKISARVQRTPPPPMCSRVSMLAWCSAATCRLRGERKKILVLPPRRYLCQQQDSSHAGVRQQRFVDARVGTGAACSHESARQPWQHPSWLWDSMPQQHTGWLPHGHHADKEKPRLPAHRRTFFWSSVKAL